MSASAPSTNVTHDLKYLSYYSHYKLDSLADHIFYIFLDSTCYSSQMMTHKRTVSHN